MPGPTDRRSPAETDWFECMPHPVIEFDGRGEVLRENRAATRLRESIEPGGGGLAWSRILPADIARLAAECRARGEGPDGLESAIGGRSFSWVLRPLGSGGTVGAFGFEITPWKAAEAALQRKDNLLRAVANAADVILGAPHAEVPFGDVLAELGQATGASRIYVFRNHRGEDDVLLASQLAEWTQPQVESQLDNPELQGVPYEMAGMGRWASELARGRTIAGTIDEFPAAEQELLRPQGILALVVTPIVVDGDFWGFIGFDDCEIERRWTPAELDILRAAADIVAGALARQHTSIALEQSRDQLRHAQRMESIGRLAGGIAHDFNNLLSGILGNAELLLAELGDDHAALSDLDEIRRSALRAAGLTRQLLAFSRKQAIEPTVVELGELLAGMEGLLERLIGEDVDMESWIEPGLPAVWADPGQLEQVVMNLVVNARDAMPDGGRIALSVQRATLDEEQARSRGLDPGRHYVLLRVTDSGSGMDEATREQAFEPFFTTKSSGTGMGLSIIYGIARQSGGTAWITSSPGMGTQVTVALPVSSERVDRAANSEEDAGPAGPGGRETLLLVEDEEAVRTLVTRMLEGAGYRVIAAASGRSGMDALRRHGAALDLLLTDIGLPDMSGIELAAACKELLPGLPVLFVSGFPGQRASGRPFVDEVPDFLPKPFTRAALLSRVRAELDGSQA